MSQLVKALLGVGFEPGLWPLFLALLNVLIYVNTGKEYFSGERKGRTNVADVMTILQIISFQWMTSINHLW